MQDLAKKSYFSVCQKKPEMNCLLSCKFRLFDAIMDDKELLYFNSFHSGIDFRNRSKKMNFMTVVTTNSFILHINRSFQDDKMKDNRIDFDKIIRSNR